MATAAEIRDRAANDLGVMRLGQSLQYQDQVRIEAAYAEVYAQLKTKGEAIWASDGDVPDELTPHVAALIAENCLQTYSVSTERYQRIKIEANKARRDIPMYTTPEHEDGEDPTDY